MIYFISIIKPNPKNKSAERPSATAAFDYARHSLPTFLASQRCFFNIYLNICCSFRFHFSSVTFEWFKLDGCLCIHFFPPHLIQRMKSFHAPNIAPPHLPGNQQRKATECVKERDGMTKRQKSRRKRKTFVKKIWIWNENMLEWMNWNRNGLSGPNESLHERASKKCQSRCRTFHSPSPLLQTSTQCCK